MKCLVTGASGLLGGHLMQVLPDPEAYGQRLEDCRNDVQSIGYGYDRAFLCAGTKGFAACEGNAKAFRADVDGNIFLARHLLKTGTFVVFVSTDAVEVAAGSAYARNRLLVELAIGGLPNVAIFRPGRFDKDNVHLAARACADVGIHRIEGLTRWP